MSTTAAIIPLLALFLFTAAAAAAAQYPPPHLYQSDQIFPQKSSAPVQSPAGIPRRLTFSDEEKDYLRQKKEIRMCVDPDWMPLEKIENGRHVGMTADYIRILEEVIGIPIVMVPTTTWNESIALAKARRCDIYSLAMPTPERRTYMDFTRPYLSIPLPLVLAARNDTPFIDDISVITNQKIGIVKGYAFNETLRQRYPKMQIVDVPTVREGLKMVAKGEIFGLIETLATVGYTIQKNFVGELKVAGKFDERWELGIGARNDEPLLTRIFDRAIASIDPATHQQILNNWIAVRFEQKPNYTLLLQLALLILVGVAMLLIRNHTLSKYNQQLARQNQEITRQSEKLKHTAQLLQFTQHAVDNCAFPIVWAKNALQPQQTKIIHANQAALRMLDYSQAEIQQLTLSDLDLNLNQQTWNERLREMRTSTSFSQTTSYRCRHGRQLPVEIYLNYFEYRNQAYHFVFFQDISRQQEMENKLNRSMKMEAIGLMAGGVAHDLNNILSGIISYPKLMLMQLPRNSPLRKPIKAILEAGQRAAAMVADMLTVTRGVAAAKEILNVNHFIIDFLDSAEIRACKANYPLVELSTELADDLLAIKCSSTHLRKCLLNLVLNAFEAIQGPGHITLTTTNYFNRKAVAENNFLKSGEYIQLAIQDSGTGISATDKAHIFEPFYSKKIMGRSGTGLGLTVVWNSIHDHQGEILVDSDNQGTTFRIYLPATRESPSPGPTDRETAFNETPKELFGNQETILIVDDEKLQRDIAAALLRSLNYQILAADSGEDGIRLLEKNKVDLVLLDMIMDPGLNGRETSEKMRARQPRLRILVASGFSQNEEVEKILAQGQAALFASPTASDSSEAPF
ncbi:MAG TPA: transporter substrate-binding domain-containing protein [Proteobacteria bacterium]|nr:transporter substrate-binding domain-containing protein [Pseudomonadota bacterium]